MVLGEEMIIEFAVLRQRNGFFVSTQLIGQRLVDRCKQIEGALANTGVIAQHTAQGERSRSAQAGTDIPKGNDRRQPVFPDAIGGGVHLPGLKQRDHPHDHNQHRQKYECASRSHAYFQVPQLHDLLPNKVHNG
ncbi:hypothetical protein D9M71_618770 [compost metagenome]